MEGRNRRSHIMVNSSNLKAEDLFLFEILREDLYCFSSSPYCTSECIKSHILKVKDVQAYFTK